MSLQTDTEELSSSQLWLKVLSNDQTDNILQQAMAQVAQNLSLMLNRPITIEHPRVITVSLANLMTGFVNPEMETVGIYLLVEGALQGQSLLILDIADAFYLVDLLMDMPPGSTEELDDLAKSGLAEIGNLSLAAFLNTVARITGYSVRPSPPAVVVDMAASILDVIASTTLAANSDQLIIIESTFRDTDKIMQCRFWVLPNPDENIRVFC